MIGHLEVSQRNERSPEQYRRVIQLAHKRSVELGQIVESLLFLGRADTSTLTQFEPLEIVSWLKSFLENRPAHDRSTDIALLSNTQAALWVRAQPQLLAQLIENLLDNACKYSCPGQAIRVSVASDGGSAIIAVEDSGCGIAPEDLTRIFEPFFRSTSTSHRGVAGVGLGLSVVERIARAFHGSVAAQSEVGHGSRIHVRLPITALSSQEYPPTAPARFELSDPVPIG
jgi:signal transduction histidine kinase